MPLDLHVLRRRASVPKDFGRQSHELSPTSPGSAKDIASHTQDFDPELETGRRHIHDAVRQSQGKKSRAIVRWVRCLQISLSPFLLALSVVLLRHYAALHEQCTDKQDCKFTRHARGTFGFCIGPAIFGLIEGGVGLFATFTTSVAVPPILTVVLDNVAGGFFMSGGTTIAAMLDDLPCHQKKGSDSGTCGQIYTTMAVCFTGIPLAYGMSFWAWYVRARYNRRRRGVIPQASGAQP